MKELGTAIIENGKIKLPALVMDELFLDEGDQLIFLEKGGKIYLKRKTSMHGRKEKGVYEASEGEKQSSEQPIPFFGSETQGNPLEFIQKAFQDENIQKTFSNVFQKVFENIDTLKDMTKVPEKPKYEPAPDDEENDTEEMFSVAFDDEDDEKVEFEAENQTKDEELEEDNSKDSEKKKEKRFKIDIE